MKALVTGGGGFLGGAIVRMLRERGDSVVVLGRGRYPQLDALGVVINQGDLRDAAAVRTTCRGVDAVFHVAAKAGVWGKRRDYWSINVDGTRNLIEACRASGTPRLIHTSTPSVVSGDGDLCGVDESQPYPSKFLCDYAASKAAAEKLVLQANGSTLKTVALRPHLIFGPGDPHLIPRVLERARAGKLMQVGDGRNLVDVTYIDNAARAHILACDALGGHGRCAGRAYFISQGEPVSLWSWLGKVLQLADAPPIRRAISYQTAYRVGAAMELVHRAVPWLGEPRMTRFVATQLAKSHYFDISAARRDLGYEPVISTDEGVEMLRRNWGVKDC